MKNKTAQTSMIYTGVVLLFFILLVNLTLSRPGGGIFSSIGILIVSLFQLVFFVIGLAVGIAICIAVMLGIFIAAAYLVNNHLGKDIAQKCKTAALAQFRWLLAVIVPGKFGGLQPVAAYSGGATAASLPLDMVRAVSTSSAPSAHTDQVAGVLRQIEGRLNAIEASVQSIEVNAAQYARTEELDAIGLAVQTSVERSHEVLDTRVTPLQEQLEQISKQSEELTAASKKLGDIVLRIVTLEQKATQFAELPQQVASLRDEFVGKYDAFPQQIADLKAQLQQQIDTLQQKPAAKSRTRKKSSTSQS